MRIRPLMMVVGVWIATLGAWVLAPHRGELAPQVVKSTAPLALPAEQELVPTPEKGLATTAQALFVPFVTGKILNLAASPDGERAAFLLEKEADQYALGFYNLKSRQLLTEARFAGTPDTRMSTSILWSPDSQYVAHCQVPIPLLFDRDGRELVTRLTSQNDAIVDGPSGALLS